MKKLITKFLVVIILSVGVLSLLIAASTFPWTFPITFSPAPTTTATGTGNITVTNVLTLDNHTLDAGAKTWTLSDSGTPFVISTGTFTPNTSTMAYEGNGATAKLALRVGFD